MLYDSLFYSFSYPPQLNISNRYYTTLKFPPEGGGFLAFPNGGQSTSQSVHGKVVQKVTKIPISTPSVSVIVTTSTPSTTPTSTPVSTPVQTQAPTSSVCQGVNGNPWCYDFTQGSYIYSPNANFCSYFTCVSTFWKDTNGYVAQCANTHYTHSGGVSGACSYNGGILQVLYSH